MSDDRLLQSITRFLDASYPCRCTDPQCPGNFHEAVEIVELVRAHLLRSVPRSWATRFHDDTLRDV